MPWKMLNLAVLLRNRQRRGSKNPLDFGPSICGYSSSLAPSQPLAPIQSLLADGFWWQRDSHKPQTGSYRSSDYIMKPGMRFEGLWEQIVARRLNFTVQEPSTRCCRFPLSFFMPKSLILEWLWRSIFLDLKNFLVFESVRWRFEGGAQGQVWKEVVEWQPISCWSVILKKA